MGDGEWGMAEGAWGKGAWGRGRGGLEHVEGEQGQARVAGDGLDAERLAYVIDAAVGGDDEGDAGGGEAVAELGGGVRAGRIA